jgi:hypothetical protein
MIQGVGWKRPCVDFLFRVQRHFGWLRCQFFIAEAGIPGAGRKQPGTPFMCRPGDLLPSQAGNNFERAGPPLRTEARTDSVDCGSTPRRTNRPIGCTAAMRPDNPG